MVFFVCADRVRRHAVRACRMRLDSEDDMLNGSDFSYNDDDDEPIYKSRRSFRRITRRLTRHRTQVAGGTQNGENVDDDGQEEERENFYY